MFLCYKCLALRIANWAHCCHTQSISHFLFDQIKVDNLLNCVTIEMESMAEVHIRNGIMFNWAASVVL